jgi:hypothetical protein
MAQSSWALAWQHLSHHRSSSTSQWQARYTVRGEFSKQIVPNRFVQHLSADVDSNALKQDIDQLVQDHGLQDAVQISLTSMSGEDDFTCTIGRIAEVKYPERAYRTPLKCLAGTYLESIIKQYPEYYRWRVLKLPPRTVYSIHHDSINGWENHRLHIPVVTNPHAYLTFFEDIVSHDHVDHRDAKMIYLHPNNVYNVNTTSLHSAGNYGTQDRIHIVAVKYQSR